MKNLLIYIFAVLSAATLLANPFTFPKPTGQYPVGTRYMHFTDHDRDETFSRSIFDKREITAQVWYPARIEGTPETRSYRNEDEALLLSTIEAQYFGLLISKLPADKFAHFSEIKTHSFQDAPLAKSGRPFPVLIYSHGIIGGHVSTHSTLMEELASHGYVVFSISHAYQTPYMKYPDGTIKAFSPSTPAIRKAAGEIMNPEVHALFAELGKSSSLDQQKKLLEKISAGRAFLSESVSIWADDIVFAMDQISNLNTPSGPLKGSIDLNRIGLLGWSFGGASSAQAALQDQRVKAVINLDGTTVGDLLKTQLNVPFMFLDRDNRTRSAYLLNNLRNSCYVVNVKGTTHFNFTDMALYNIPEVDKIMGSVNGEEGIKLINSYVLAFFNKHLRNKPSDLLSVASLQKNNKKVRIALVLKEEQ